MTNFLLIIKSHWRKNFFWQYMQASNCNCQNIHRVKSVEIQSFLWSVFSHIWTEYGPEKTLYWDTFHAVISLTHLHPIFNFCTPWKHKILSFTDIFRGCRNVTSSAHPLNNLENSPEKVSIFSLTENCSLATSMIVVLPQQS